ncbi:MAG: hypothetical protein DMF79_09125 [Acidobacteria bacterium]|nr:MAG: hypothetical protein DMF79_09125 [Acidobacteriota bacterium]
MWATDRVSISFVHSPTAPTPIGTILGSTARMASTTRLCFLTYSERGMWPSCHSPYISLPMPHHLTP